MGNPESKVKRDAPEKASLPSVPILTPQKNRFSDLDPRSPSANIVRTPIEILSSTKIPEDVDNAKSTITCLDPRSPTVEFTRTPIVVESNTNGLRIQNKNLENVRKQLVNLTPMRSDLRKSPKLLESSPISPKDVKKRNSIVGLLETNIDYVETDLDAVIIKNTNNKLKAKFLGVELNSGDDTQVEEDDMVNKAKNLDDKAKTDAVDVLQCLTIPEETVKDNTSVLEGETAKENIIEAIETIPEDSIQKENEKIKEEDVAEKLQEDIYLQEQIDIGNKMKENLLIELDKKLTNLIYEDKDAPFESPTRTTTKFKEGCRTPLGTKNGNGVPKSIPKLKVHDKPTLRSDYSVSRIPVFREKRGGANKGKFQCENTPPIKRNVLDETNKIKRSQWDADKTLII